MGRRISNLQPPYSVVEDLGLCKQDSVSTDISGTQSQQTAYNTAYHLAMSFGYRAIPPHLSKQIPDTTLLVVGGR